MERFGFSDGLPRSLKPPEAVPVGENPYPQFDPMQVPTTQIPIESFDGAEYLRGKITSAMAPVPGEPLSHTTLRIQKLKQFGDLVDNLPVLNREQADQIYSSWYSTLNPDQSQLSTFSPEARALMEQAYGPSALRRRQAGGQDVDPAQRDALLGYTVASLLGGRGVGGALRAVPTLFEDAQARLDAQFAQDQAQEGLRRAGLKTQLDEQLAVDKYNRAQAGFAADDARNLELERLRQTGRVDLAGRKEAGCQATGGCESGFAGGLDGRPGARRGSGEADRGPVRYSARRGFGRFASDDNASTPGGPGEAGE